MTARPRHRIADRIALDLLQPFIDTEEKGFVLPNRPTKCPPEVVPVKRRNSERVKKVPRIQVVVAEVIIRSAMELVRAALTHHQELAAHGHAVFGAESVG